MSHQTGITGSAELKDVFRRCTTSDEFRLVKVGITDEELVCIDTVAVQSNSWRDDYDASVKPLLEEKQPCYIFYRLESKDKWLFIAYTPDKSPVRQKMLFAGTRATVKTEFGTGFIMKELIGTAKNEVTLSGYDEDVRSCEAPPPLTDAEEEKKAIKEAENNTDIGVDTRHKTHSGLSFPLTDDLQGAINRFKGHDLNYLQLRINLQEEFIYLSTSGSHSIQELEREAPVDDAYYHIYRFDHTFKGEHMSSVVFVYTMPGTRAPIKARMLYSSCKSTLVEDLTNVYGLVFEKTLESQDQPLSEDYLMSEVHPPVAEVREKFSKPKAPGRRAPTKRPGRSNN